MLEWQLAIYGSDIYDHCQCSPEWFLVWAPQKHLLERIWQGSGTAEVFPFWRLGQSPGKWTRENQKAKGGICDQKQKQTTLDYKKAVLRQIQLCFEGNYQSAHDKTPTYLLLKTRWIVHHHSHGSTPTTASPSSINARTQSDADRRLSIDIFHCRRDLLPWHEIGHMQWFRQKAVINVLFSLHDSLSRHCSTLKTGSR